MYEVMNPRMNDGGLSLSLRAELIASRSTTGRDNRLHDDSPFLDGPTFLDGKAMSCRNPYVANVQAVAPL